MKTSAEDTFTTEIGQRTAHDKPANTTNSHIRHVIHVDPTVLHPVSPLLYGVFFEEINNAGDGGLYAELVRDRSFDAMANALRDTHDRIPQEQSKGRTEHSLQRLNTAKLLGQAASSKKHLNRGLQEEPRSWFEWMGTNFTLTTDHPISAGNPVAALLQTQEIIGGIANTGYWGMSVEGGKEYFFSAFAALPQISGNAATPKTGEAKWMRVALESQDGRISYASTTFYIGSSEWKAVNATLSPLESDKNARLGIAFQGPGQLLLDVVSLFPVENVRKHELNPWPFRSDLSEAVRALKPRFLRVPGGCYVEGGDFLKDRFQWKNALGCTCDRPGHMNANWGYWSTDGLGLYEYMLLAEELGAEPVWVVNNGISHREDVPTAQIGPWIQDTLDALEFITGSPDKKWGAVRASMGHEHPWNLTYLAIGNEDCGHPSYVGNYISFYFAIKAHYPHMQLIANCPMGDAAPTDIFDWHIYTNTGDMFRQRHAFDGMVAGRDPHVFASEYAVLQDGGWGNLQAAVAEAAFMTGLEANSEVVRMASYAPLFVNSNARVWNPDMIVFDSHRWYGTPSYMVQGLFSHYQGVQYMATAVEAYGSITGPDSATVAASVTCQDELCAVLALKVVNVAHTSQNVTVRLREATARKINDTSLRTVITGPHPEAENTFDEPLKVKPEVDRVQLLFHEDKASFDVELPAVSVSFYELHAVELAITEPTNLPAVS
ncbi:g2297 [Coccomyxa elongata]